MVLGIFQLSFVNSGYGVDARYYNGWIYIAGWMLLLISNLFFICFASFYKNYHLTVKVFVRRKQLRDFEKTIELDIEFKETLLENNSESFMIAFEVLRQKRFLEHMREENKIFSMKAIRKKDLAWLKRNHFTEE